MVRNPRLAHFGAFSCFMPLSTLLDINESVALLDYRFMDYFMYSKDSSGQIHLSSIVRKILL